MTPSAYIAIVLYLLGAVGATSYLGKSQATKAERRWVAVAWPFFVAVLLAWHSFEDLQRRRSKKG